MTWSPSSLVTILASAVAINTDSGDIMSLVCHVDIYDQDRESLIGRIGKLLCLNTENPRVKAWPCTLEINNSKWWIYMGIRGILPFNLTYGHKT